MDGNCFVTIIGYFKMNISSGFNDRRSVIIIVMMEDARTPDTSINHENG